MTKIQNHIGQIRKDIETRGEIEKKLKKTGRGGIETARDFSVIVDLYLSKRLKNVDGVPN